MKPKKTQPEKQDERQERDFFQTPNYATDLIVPYLSRGVVWECAAGGGKMADRLIHNGFEVIESDIEQNDDLHYRANFLTYHPMFSFDMIVTNPPFSLKRKFFERCLFHGVPFALLLPADFSGWILNAMMRGAQWLIPTRRIDYITPTGRNGKSSSAQFHSGWFCYGLNLPKQVTIIELTKEMKDNV